MSEEKDGDLSEMAPEGLAHPTRAFQFVWVIITLVAFTRNLNLSELVLVVQLRLTLPLKRRRNTPPIIRS